MSEDVKDEIEDYFKGDEFERRMISFIRDHLEIRAYVGRAMGTGGDEHHELHISLALDGTEIDCDYVVI